MGGSLTKVTIGKEDIEVQEDGAWPETFNRTSSTGGTLALRKFPDIWNMASGGLNALSVGSHDLTDTTLALACLTIDTDVRVLHISPGSWVIDADLDLSSYSNIYFYMLPGAIFAVSAASTLTLPSPANIIAQPNQQIKTGTGTMLFSTGTGVAYAGWWAGQPHSTADQGEDDTTALHEFLNSGANEGYITGDGYYMIDGTAVQTGMVKPGLNIPSNFCLTLSPGIHIQQLNEASDDAYNVFVVYLKDNVTINGNGAYLIGDSAYVASKPGAVFNGIGVRVMGSSNVTVRDLNITTMWADGWTVIYDNVSYANSSNVRMLNINSYGNYRNGASVIGVDGCEIIGGSYSGSTGTAPKDGIDVEPNTDRGDTNPSVVENLSIIGVDAYDNTDVGIEIYQAGTLRNVSVTGCSAWDNGVGIRTRGEVNATITGNATYSNTSAGMSAFNSSEAVFDGNTMTAENSGFLFNNTAGVDSTDISVMNNLIIDSAGHGIHMAKAGTEEIQKCNISGNRIKDSAARGINAVLVLDSIISNNIITESGDHNLVLTSCDRNIVTGGIVALSDDHGIYLSSSDDNLISNIFIHSNSQTTDDTDSNLSITASDRNTLRSLIIRQGSETNKPKYGIEIDATCDNTIIQDCDLYDSGKTGIIADSGGETDIRSNRRGADPLTGSFTLAAAATNTITNTNVMTTSKITITPTNAAAASLMAGASALYISAKTAGTSFAVTTADAGNPGGTETFDYVIK